MLRFHYPDWMEEAACQYTDPDLFYPEDGQFSVKKARAAVRICRHCPVIMECLTWAFQVDDQFGVLGGMTPRERRRLKSDVMARKAG